MAATELTSVVSFIILNIFLSARSHINNVFSLWSKKKLSGKVGFKSLSFHKSALKGKIEKQLLSFSMKDFAPKCFKLQFVFFEYSVFSFF